MVSSDSYHLLIAGYALHLSETLPGRTLLINKQHGAATATIEHHLRAAARVMMDNDVLLDPRSTETSFPPTSLKYVPFLKDILS